MKRIRFSVVIPVYNVELYLAETIESVLNQIFDLNSIEIILVNDGSPDNSYLICEEYQEKYPNIIKYIKKENGGVSSARNLGLEYATGDFVNFLDSDDMWEKDVFAKVAKMFDKHPEIDIVGVRQKYFEAINGYTSLDYKYFNGDGVYDVMVDYDLIQLSVTSSFMRTKVAKMAQYDTKIKYSEDAKYIYELFIAKKQTKLGLIGSSVHLYRKRFSENSAIQVKDNRIDWYKQTVELSYLYLLNKAEKEFPKLLKTIKYYIMYDYQWRLKFDFQSTKFSEAEKNDYIENTKKIFAMMDDEIILKQRTMSPLYKQLAFKLKYGSYDEAIKKYYEKANDQSLCIEIINRDNGQFVIEGSLNYIYNDEMKLYYKNKKNEEIEIKLSKNLFDKCENLLGDQIVSYYFNFTIPEIIDKITFYSKYGNEKRKIHIKYGLWAPLSNHNQSYHNYDKLTLTKTSNKAKDLIIEKRTFFNTIKHEIKYTLSLLKHGKKRAPFYRLCYYFYKMFSTRKEIWIISDRKNAGDNGEAFFEYLNKINDKNIKCYFAIDKNDKDVNKMKEYGKVIYFDTLKYKMLFMKAKKIISSQADPFVYIPDNRCKNYINDLYNFDFIFLQHGIITHDLSSWLNKFKKNIKLFVTSTKNEYDLIIENHAYGFDRKIVKLTGLARYDKLKVAENKNSNSIMFSPTWRTSLAEIVDEKTKKRKYNPKFIESDFYKFYQKLFNDKELIEVLEKNKYNIRVCLHPNMIQQIGDFNSSSKNIIFLNSFEYRDEFINNDLLITDYSSIRYDFAYLKKPVIYNHFDIDSFFEGQLYEIGDASYKDEGFGPIVYNYEQLKKELISSINKKFLLSKKSDKNIEKHFAFIDNNNCKRIYEEIKKI